MTLYEIDKNIHDLIVNAIDPETGELKDISEDLAQLQMDRETKCENIALVIKNLTAEANALRNEEKVLADRRRTDENRVEWLKNYLASSLAGEPFRTTKVMVTFRKSMAVYIEDEVEFLREHPQFARIKTEVDKAELKDVLKSGETVSGAVLEERTSMIVR